LTNLILQALNSQYSALIPTASVLKKLNDYQLLGDKLL